MKIRLANHIEILTTPAIEQQVIKSFTFANPKYNDALSFGRSTRGLDRQIKLVEYLSSGLVAPMGALSYLLQTFKPKVIDQRQIVKAVILFAGTLRPYQEQFIVDAIRAGGGGNVSRLQVQEKRFQVLLWLHDWDNVL